MIEKIENNAGKIMIPLLIVFVLILVIAALVVGISEADRETKVSACDSKGEVYDVSTDRCREKTTSERLNEKCSDGISIDGKLYTCAELRNLGLEKAYLDGNIIKHGDNIYERGTAAEITAGKQVGDYCLSADDAWYHIGETRCVVFRYEYFACSNGYCFLDEKRDYTSGFVAFFGRYYMYNWNTFSAEYQSGVEVSNILVCGQIYLYQGHPEIKIVNTGQVIKNPTQTYGAYAYSCK